MGLLSAFVALPLGVGARTWFYARGLAERRAEQRAARPPLLALPAPKAKSAAAESDADNVIELFPDASDPEVAAEEIVVEPEPEPEPEEPAGPLRPPPTWTPDLERPKPEWIAPVAPLRGSALAQAVTVPVLLAHANDREPHPAWWSPPEHPEEPPVA